MRCVRLAVCLAALTLWASVPAFAEKRAALVIGNDRYDNLPSLQKAANDAAAVGDTLARLGYQVVRGRDLGRQGIIDKLSEFTARLEPGDTALFFYAGHGVAIGGINYLVPADAPSADIESRVRGASIAEADVIAEIQARGARVAVLVLDACRDNPFPRTGTRSVGNTRGLAGANPARGVFVLYSAGSGQTALDRLTRNDPNPNSVFTRVFVEQLAKPGLHLGDLAVEVREKVAALALTARTDQGEPLPHEQTPAYYDQTIGGRVFLGGREPVGQTQAGTQPAADEIAWRFLRNTTDTAAVRRFLGEFPNTTFRAEAEARLASLERDARDKVATVVAPGGAGPPVATRAVLYEEDATSQGARFVGSALWRLETAPAAAVAPADVGVRADVDVPERRLKLKLVMRRNTDRSLPASHLIELNFTLPADFPHGKVTSVPGILMKQAEQTRGAPLAGLAVRIHDASYLIGLSNADADVAKNEPLLKDRSWIDLPIVFSDGKRAIIAIEKGAAGERAFQQAFQTWAAKQ